MPPREISVTVERDVLTEMLDGSTWVGIGVLIQMPDADAESGWRAVRFTVESLDYLSEPMLRVVAGAFARIVHPSDPWCAQRLELEYLDQIDVALAQERTRAT